MENKVNMPKLEESNFTHWKIALQANATLFGALDYLYGSPPTPTDHASAETHKKHQSFLISLIITSVSSEILNHLPTPPDTTPYNLTTAIENYLCMTTPHDH